MTKENKLAMLKQNLQLLTATQDDYLRLLLDAAAASLARSGIRDDNTIDYDVCQIDYAAWTYRKRAASTMQTGQSSFHHGGETAMPRFLRISINNLITSQKIKEAQTP